MSHGSHRAARGMYVWRCRKPHRYSSPAMPRGAWDEQWRCWSILRTIVAKERRSISCPWHRAVAGCLPGHRGGSRHSRQPGGLVDAALISAFPFYSLPRALARRVISWRSAAASGAAAHPLGHPVNRRSGAPLALRLYWLRKPRDTFGAWLACCVGACLIRPPWLLEPFVPP